MSDATFILWGPLPGADDPRVSRPVLWGCPGGGAAGAQAESSHSGRLPLRWAVDQTPAHFSPRSDGVSALPCPSMPLVLTEESLTKPSVMCATGAGRKVYTWVVDDEAALKRSVDLGLHGVVSNRPAAILRLKQEWE
eukprot:6640880-Pyramimonas_sp.AAC.2